MRAVQLAMKLLWALVRIMEWTCYNERKDKEGEGQ
ncbi:hypothetical protein B23_2418 [Geobacillus thermoleovorans B23]|nr:hypothetical protein B23_2418 [Geobacillus thermoleovorans B23]